MKKKTVLQKAVKSVKRTYRTVTWTIVGVLTVQNLLLKALNEKKPASKPSPKSEKKAPKAEK